jgi:hypothetical protein
LRASRERDHPFAPQQIRTLEERKTGDSESETEEEVENEVENVALHNAEGELARVTTELEEEKLKNADLYSKNTNLTVEILFAKTASELASPPRCEDCVVHEAHYKWLSRCSSSCPATTARSTGTIETGQTRGWLEGVGSSYPKSFSWVTSGGYTCQRQSDRRGASSRAI